MAENKNILEVHHLKKSFTTGKKSFTAVEDVSSSLFRDTGSSGTLYKSCGCSGHHTAQPKSRDLFSGGRAWSEII